MTKAKEIVEFIEPALKRQYVNGSWKYQTTWGTKTREGLIAVIHRIILEPGGIK